MRPEKCKNCGSVELEAQHDGYRCPYCETLYPHTQPVVVKEVHYVPQYRSPSPVRPVSNFDLTGGRRKKNKWIAWLLCFFLGLFGGHKFYEEKYGMGILYLFTAGLFGFGWLIDLVAILCKPNTYYVNK